MTIIEHIYRNTTTPSSRRYWQYEKSKNSVCARLSFFRSVGDLRDFELEAKKILHVALFDFYSTASERVESTSRDLPGLIAKLRCDRLNFDIIKHGIEFNLNDHKLFIQIEKKVNQMSIKLEVFRKKNACSIYITVSTVHASSCINSQIMVTFWSQRDRTRNEN